MATTIVQKFGGPSPTVPITINAPAFNGSDSRSAQDRFVDQQWRDAKAANLGALHPGAINKDAGHTS